LPFPFHANHPAYNKFVKHQLNEIIKRGKGQLSLNDMVNLQHALKMHILNAYKIWHKAVKSGKAAPNLNDYFKFLNSTLGIK